MNEKFNFELNFVELNTIVKGLKELPYKESNSIIDKLIAEYEKQAKEAQEAAIKKKKEADSKDSKA